MFGFLANKNPLKKWCPSSSIPEINGAFLASEACNSKTTDSCKSCCICLANVSTELKNPMDSWCCDNVLFMFIYFLYHLPLGFHDVGSVGWKSMKLMELESDSTLLHATSKFCFWILGTDWSLLFFPGNSLTPCEVGSVG